MSIEADIAGVTVLAVLPAVFLAVSFTAKRAKSSTWSLDGTLLVLALVEMQGFSIHSNIPAC